MPLTKEDITEWEAEGRLDPKCDSCRWAYEGKESPFQPSHKANSACESGKHPHCSCDTCF